MMKHIETTFMDANTVRKTSAFTQARMRKHCTDIDVLQQCVDSWLAIVDTWKCEQTLREQSRAISYTLLSILAEHSLSKRFTQAESIARMTVHMQRMCNIELTIHEENNNEN